MAPKIADPQKRRFQFDLPADIKNEYLEQSDTLEYKAVTTNGEIKFGSWIVRYSGFLQHMLGGDKNFKNSKKVHFNGEKDSVVEKAESVKMFFDIMHGVLPAEPDLVQTLELLKFLNSDGKLIFDFENKMFDFYIRKMKVINMSAKQMMMACMILKSYGLEENKLEKCFVKRTAWQTIRNLLWHGSSSETEQLGELIVGRTKDDPQFEPTLEAEMLKYIQTLKKYFGVTVVSGNMPHLSGVYKYQKELLGEFVYYKRLSDKTTVTLALSLSGERWKIFSLDKEFARSYSTDLLSDQWETYNESYNAWESDFAFTVTKNDKFPFKAKSRKRKRDVWVMSDTEESSSSESIKPEKAPRTENFFRSMASFTRVDSQ